jgi:hypothetical protein
VHEYSKTSNRAIFYSENFIKNSINKNSNSCF